MFPEITRDDVFRLETRHLWLRWPTAGEGSGVLDGTAAFSGDTTLEDAAGDPYRRSATLTAWRAANAAGMELHLLLTGRGMDRHVVGAVDLVPVRGRVSDCGVRLRAWIEPAARGRGFATEAVRAAIDAAFMLTDTSLVSASSHVLDPAFRRVLEKCGFGSCGTGLDPAPDGQSLTASDRFRLDRKVWASFKAWRMSRPLHARPVCTAMCGAD